MFSFLHFSLNFKISTAAIFIYWENEIDSVVDQYETLQEKKYDWNGQVFSSQKIFYALQRYTLFL